ncbi:hypothetical protein BD779DRAFT_1765092 [Infundibulicybe gibba]|nr:hypothetical protein BD779DRAFT_1765092 [Infundibulicybe gibba]
MADIGRTGSASGQTFSDVRRLKGCSETSGPTQIGAVKPSATPSRDQCMTLRFGTKILARPWFSLGGAQIPVVSDGDQASPLSSMPPLRSSNAVGSRRWPRRRCYHAKRRIWRFPHSGHYELALIYYLLNSPQAEMMSVAEVGNLIQFGVYEQAHE